MILQSSSDRQPGMMTLISVAITTAYVLFAQIKKL